MVRGSSLLGPKWAGFPGCQEREVTATAAAQALIRPQLSVSTLHALNP